MKADKTKAIRMLKTARGQLEGLIKMIEDDRYCIDISNQLMATQAIIKKVNHDVIQAHIGCCVKEAFEQGKEEEKIEEIVQLLDKLSK